MKYGLCLQKNNYENFLTWRRLPDDPDTMKYYIWRKQINSRDSLVELIVSTGNNCFIDKAIKDGIKYLYNVGIYNSVPDKFLKVIRIIYCREGWRGKDNSIGFLLVDNSGKTI